VACDGYTVCPHPRACGIAGKCLAHLEEVELPAAEVRELDAIVPIPGADLDVALRMPRGPVVRRKGRIRLEG